MGDTTKRLFISDIHMGDDRSMKATPNPYVWFKKNIPLLAHFLDNQLNTPDVKEVVILGDLFDQWIIPASFDPVTSFDTICSNDANKSVIDNLKALGASSDIKLTYVPGNHDMAIDAAGILKMKEFMENTFKGINFICDYNVPLGRYEAGKLVAEHGNRYCLFNSPDVWTKPDVSFLPLGYFISRMVAYKELMTGSGQHTIDIIVKFIGDSKQPDFIEHMLDAIAKDCGLDGGEIQLKDLPGYGGTMTIEEVGRLFSGLKSRWGKLPGAEKVGADLAIESDQGDLNEAADKTFFYPRSEIKVVIFGHTHTPNMWKGDYDIDTKSDNAPDPDKTPCPVIYANSGTWVDNARNGCTYVETEEADGKLYVRVKEYPSKTVLDDFQGFVET